MSQRTNTIDGRRAFKEQSPLNMMHPAQLETGARGLLSQFKTSKLIRKLSINSNKDELNFTQVNRRLLTNNKSSKSYKISDTLGKSEYRSSSCDILLENSGDPSRNTRRNLSAPGGRLQTAYEARARSDQCQVSNAVTDFSRHSDGNIDVQVGHNSDLEDGFSDASTAKVKSECRYPSRVGRKHEKMEHRSVEEGSGLEENPVVQPFERKDDLENSRVVTGTTFDDQRNCTSRGRNEEIRICDGSGKHRSSDERRRRRPSDERERPRPSDEREKRRPSDERQRRKSSDERAKRRPSDETEKRRPSDERERRRSSDEREKIRPSDERKKSIPSNERVKRGPSDGREKRRPSDERERRRSNYVNNSPTRSTKEIDKALVKEAWEQRRGGVSTFKSGDTKEHQYTSRIIIGGPIHRKSLAPYPPSHHSHLNCGATNEPAKQPATSALFSDSTPGYTHGITDNYSRNQSCQNSHLSSLNPCVNSIKSGFEKNDSVSPFVPPPPPLPHHLQLSKPQSNSRMSKVSQESEIETKIVPGVHVSRYSGVDEKRLLSVNRVAAKTVVTHSPQTHSSILGLPTKLVTDNNDRPHPLNNGPKESTMRSKPRVTSVEGYRNMLSKINKDRKMMLETNNSRAGSPDSMRSYSSSIFSENEDDNRSYLRPVKKFYQENLSRSFQPGFDSTVGVCRNIVKDDSIITKKVIPDNSSSPPIRNLQDLPSKTEFSTRANSFPTKEHRITTDVRHTEKGIMYSINFVKENQLPDQGSDRFNEIQKAGDQPFGTPLDEQSIGSNFGYKSTNHLQQDGCNDKSLYMYGSDSNGESSDREANRETEVYDAVVHNTFKHLPEWHSETANPGTDRLVKCARDEESGVTIVHKTWQVMDQTTDYPEQQQRLLHCKQPQPQQELDIHPRKELIENVQKPSSSYFSADSPGTHGSNSANMLPKMRKRSGGDVVTSSDLSTLTNVIVINDERCQPFVNNSNGHQSTAQNHTVQTTDQNCNFQSTAQNPIVPNTAQNRKLNKIPGTNTIYRSPTIVEVRPTITLKCNNGSGAASETKFSRGTSCTASDIIKDTSYAVHEYEGAENRNGTTREDRRTDNNVITVAGRNNVDVVKKCDDRSKVNGKLLFGNNDRVVSSQQQQQLVLLNGSSGLEKKNMSRSKSPELKTSTVPLNVSSSDTGKVSKKKSKYGISFNGSSANTTASSSAGSSNLSSGRGNKMGKTGPGKRVSGEYTDMDGIKCIGKD